MRVCIVGAGDGGAMVANQIRRLDSKAQIDIFSKRLELGCPPCEMPLVINGTVTTWDELIRGFRQRSFWEKRNINLHLSAEATDILPAGKYIVAGGARYSYDRLVLALGAMPSIPSFPGLDGKNEFVLSTDMADGVAL
ncbi:NAD(P)/FAD-dependent oxidoreductase, partial [Candidatus Bipolaricaulota bacterium]|nr:NAD(P)/FAD-dependent oxidoreductase [Candidatus Bipolaricaulota bacterium]